MGPGRAGVALLGALLACASPGDPARDSASPGAPPPDRPARVAEAPVWGPRQPRLPWFRLAHSLDEDSAMSYAWHTRDRILVTDHDVESFLALVSQPNGLRADGRPLLDAAPR